MKELQVSFAANVIQPRLDWREAVENLKEEHEALLEELQALHRMAKRVGELPVIDTATLQKIRAKAFTFQTELDMHAKWEEETLFPMITVYNGEALDQFTLIEQEHLLAEQFIQAFVDAVERAPVRKYEAHEMASYLNQALLVLQEYFRMEEVMVGELVDRSNLYGY